MTVQGYNDSRFDGLARAEITQLAHGFITETVNFAACSSTTAFGSGNVRGGAIALLNGDVITNIHCFLNTAGSGLTHGQLALYDAGGSLLANTADNPTAYQSAGLVSEALTSPYSITSTGIYYVAHFVTGTSPGTNVRGQGYGSVGATSIGGNPTNAWVMTGQSSLPTTATLTSGSFLPWFAVS